MGLLKHLLFWPVTGPTALMRFSLKQVDGVVRQELTDDTSVKEDLMALQMELELGDIDEAEYQVREAELLQRLRDVRAWRVEFGLEKEWAPLEFKRDDSSQPSDNGSDDGSDEDR